MAIPTPDKLVGDFGHTADHNQISLALTAATDTANAAETPAGATSKANAAQAYAIQRANHTGTQSADTLTDGATNRLFTTAEKTKLASVAASATANQTDAYLLGRANHTGTQLSSTISDFTSAVDARISAVNDEQIDDRVNALIVAGTGITKTYDDAANTLTLASTSSFDTNLLPWTIDVDVFNTPAQNTGWSTIVADTASLHGYLSQNDGSITAIIGWDVVLAAGTWAIDLIHFKNTDHGIITLSIDGSSVGTIDAYNAGILRNQLSSVTGISVATSAKKRLTVKSTTKNGSASSNRVSLGGLRLRRTA